jgi:MtN3 and saliva related transmembrane protein
MHLCNVLMSLRFSRDDRMTSMRAGSETPSSRSHRVVANIGLIREEKTTMASALVDAVGASGAVLTTVCWVPQAVKIIRDRDTRAISLPGTLLCVIGVLLWLIYGVAIVDAPLIGSSVVTFAITAVILALKIRHG